ncbi:MAG: hypothetical protein Kow00121_60550 [Elainellaceae cyanobacterium]
MSFTREDCVRGGKAPASELQKEVVRQTALKVKPWTFKSKIGAAISAANRIRANGKLSFKRILKLKPGGDRTAFDLERDRLKHILTLLRQLADSAQVEAVNVRVRFTLNTIEQDVKENGNELFIAAVELKCSSTIFVCSADGSIDRKEELQTFVNELTVNVCTMAEQLIQEAEKAAT